MNFLENALRLFVLMLLGHVLGSCSGSDFKKYNELSELRILALKADQPEVDPGATVTVTPLISDIYNSGALTFTANACIEPGLAYGAQPTCEGNPTKIAIATNQTITSLNSTNSFTGASDPFSVSIPASEIIFEGRSEKDQLKGVPYLISFVLNSSDGRAISAFKRIIVSTSSSKNQNPSISDVLVNGGVFSFPVAQTVNLTPSFATEGKSLLTSWFISDGTAKVFRTLNSDSLEYKGPDAIPTDRKAFVIAVSRDNKGGVDYKIKTSP